MYIEQLGEFLQINKRDMASCKPDKAAILNEVVKTVSGPTEQVGEEQEEEEMGSTDGSSAVLQMA